MDIFNIDKSKSIEQLWEEHNQLDSRKILYLRHLPFGGKYREIGCHQGFGAFQAMIGRSASYLDLYDVKDNGFKQLRPYIEEYCYKNKVLFNYNLTNGSVQHGNATPVDVTWIDARKTGDFVYESLKYNAPLTSICMGVDDLVSSPDIKKGVNKFLAEQSDWVLEAEMLVYPGIAVIIRKEFVMKKGQGGKRDK